MLAFSQAAENNKEPIAEVLRRVFVNRGAILEIGSGTGQHAVHFGRSLPHLTWQASDLPENLELLAARIVAEGPENVYPPIALDVAQQPWPVTSDTFDGIFCANSIHIMSWPHVEALFAGIGAHLTENGIVCLYGPFKYAGAFTTESNARFDNWLKQRDPLSGVRDFESVDALAQAQGMVLQHDFPMPANNQLIVWQRQAPGEF